MLTAIFIYVNGIKIPATSGKAGYKNTIAYNAYVSAITNEQTIDIKLRAENNAASVTNRTKELNNISLIKKP